MRPQRILPAWSSKLKGASVAGLGLSPSLMPGWVVAESVDKKRWVIGPVVMDSEGGTDIAQICSVECPPDFCTEQSKRDALANALVIASSLDLLACCKEWLHAWEHNLQPGNLEVMRAVVAKAEGAGSATWQHLNGSAVPIKASSNILSRAADQLRNLVTDPGAALSSHSIEAQVLDLANELDKGNI